MKPPVNSTTLVRLIVLLILHSCSSNSASGPSDSASTISRSPITTEEPEPPEGNDVMGIEPSVAQPGGDVLVRYLPDLPKELGEGYHLEQWTGGDWVDVVAGLFAVRHDRDVGVVIPLGEELLIDDIGIGNPAMVRLPDDLNSGIYRICEENNRDNCGRLTVNATG